MPTLLNTRARDPLRNYQFQVSLDDLTGASLPVAGVQRVSGLSFSVASFEVWEGGNNLHRYANPDKVTWDPVTLDQGIALDDTLEKWAEAVRYFAMTGTPYTDPDTGSVVRVKRDVTIALWDPGDRVVAEFGQRVARSYHLKNAWISKYNAMPKLDALANEVALLTVELVHESWTVEFTDPLSLTTLT
jgi:phage tail-like protein